MTRMALIYYIAADIYLDPNEVNFGVDDETLRELCFQPDGRRRRIRRGELQCQRCVEAQRESAWVHLRQSGGQWRIVHHGSSQDPCYMPESDEHKALKERVATVSERNGYRAEVETGTRHRRTDVLIHAEHGLLGWEIQLRETGVGDVARRANRAVRDHIAPSWLTQPKRAPWINTVPWSMVNEAPWPIYRDDPQLRIAGGVYRLQIRDCREIKGCPHSPTGRPNYDCGQRHTSWEGVRLFADELIAKIAGGQYVPAAIPGTDGTRVARKWVTAEDLEHYAHLVDLPCTEEALPPQLRLGSRKRSALPEAGPQNDSPLHQRATGDNRTGRRRRRRNTAPAQGFDPPIPMATLAPRPAAIRFDGTCNAHPGGHRCGEPARLYQSGWRCGQHIPPPFYLPIRADDD